MKKTETKKAPAVKAPAKTPSKAPAVIPPKALAKTEPNPEIDDLIAGDAGSGQEEMGRQDYAIPRIYILQDNSPQAKKSDGKFIKGAEPGMICDPVSETLFGSETGVNVIPISYRRTHLEWKLREKGGGFVKDHGPDGDILNSCTKNDRGQDITPDGTQIVVNTEYYVFVIDASGLHSPYLLSMAGTQIKKSRQWNTMMNQLRVPNPKGGGSINPAIFYRSYNLSTVPEKNDKGSWFGWKITSATPTLQLPDGPAIYLAARAFRQQIAEGKVKSTAPMGEHPGEHHDGPM